MAKGRPKFTPRQYRQGDVLLVAIDPSALKGHKSKMTAATRQKDGGVILARGEATGHHHSVYGNATFFRPDDLAPNALGGYLEVRGDDVVLRHQEHSEIPLPPGLYKQLIQVEDNGQTARQVWD